MDKHETTKLEPLAPRWYCVSSDGVATLCKDQEDDRPLVTRILQALPEQPPTPYSGWARYKNECADFVDRLRAALGPR